MDSLADLWARSGRKPQRLYQGSTEDIVEQLKAWVKRRKSNNDLYMDASEEMFRVMDTIPQTNNQVQRAQSSDTMDLIRAIIATQMDIVDRCRKLEERKARDTFLANFFLESLKHRGIRWPQMPNTEKTPADANVCAFLGTVDRDFNAKMELEILEDTVRVDEWQAGLRRRDAIHAQNIADDPVHGVHTHRIGSVGAQFRQDITNDPTKSTMEAFTDAADAIMAPGSMEFVMGPNSTGTTSTPSTTGEATGATSKINPTADDTAVYIADMVGNINLATDDNKATTGDVTGNVKIATGPSSNVVADIPESMGNPLVATSNNAPTTPETTNIATGPSSTEFGVNDQTLPGTEEQDGSGKISKAKKKREGRKRAKAARAKEAAGIVGTFGGNDDDDNGKRLKLAAV